MSLPKVTWKRFLACACGLGGFRRVSRWCLGLFASAVSRWCLHRLGMCSVAPKLVLCGFQRWRETFFWFAVWAVFGACPDGVWVFLHLQCPDGVCIPKVTWNSFLVCGLGGFQLVSRWCLGLFASAVLVLIIMSLPKVTWKRFLACGLGGFQLVSRWWNSFLACGLGGFRRVSRWCLGLFASAVSRWCLHRLGMCSVAPKLVLCGFQRWRETVFWFAVWAVFGSCPDGV